MHNTNAQEFESVSGIRSLARTLISIVPFGRVMTRAILSLWFRDSPSYWEQRYASGGNSGAGSYGVLATFKGEFLQRFIEDNSIGSVIDFGCGDGNQIGFIKNTNYLGLDVSATAIDKCKREYESDPLKTFLLYGPRDRIQNLGIPLADMSMSLDVIYHLVEDPLFERYIANLFSAATRFVIIYSSSREGRCESPHVRHRDVKSYVADNIDGWTLDRVVSNPYKGASSESDFFVFRRAA